MVQNGQDSKQLVPNARCLGAIPRSKLWLEDTTNTDLYSHLHVQCDQIQEVISQGGNVLVHCVAGVSRSASICLAFLVKCRHMSLRDAYHHMASKRPLVRPNLGFWRQLISFEQEVTKSKGSVQLVQFDGQLIPDVYVPSEGNEENAKPFQMHSRTSNRRKFVPALDPLAEIVEAAA
ncbi:Dual specificity protein phosphatase 14 [Toxocara canis]|uniref:Dual specificity protein phosphatase 14 n=1 Tax=Toxocara canis TaxID=6265 RepID=A0A0B2VAV5_TOXCA|nr:Dual specificity protein phosphatase 14 [Toxocara canis]